jgi:hypothetical protein
MYLLRLSIGLSVLFHAAACDTRLARAEVVTLSTANVCEIVINGVKISDAVIVANRQDLFDIFRTDNNSQVPRLRIHIGWRSSQAVRG